MEPFIWPSLLELVVPGKCILMIPKSTGIFAVAQMALKISKDIGRLGAGALGGYDWAAGTLGHCDVVTMINWKMDIWTLGGWDTGTHRIGILGKCRLGQWDIGNLGR